MIENLSAVPLAFVCGKLNSDGASFIQKKFGCQKQDPALLRNQGWKKQDKIACEDSLEAPYWGIWIDGRSATGGQNAYGMQYSRSMTASMSQVYRLARNEEATLQLEVFMGIKRALGGKFVPYVQLLDEPHATRLLKCFRDHMPADAVALVMDGIILFDADFRNTMRFNLTDKQSTIQGLFNMYNVKIAGAVLPDEKLSAIAWLMRNMAFLHPLEDQNGRSRLMLLQHELRRLGLACGTMNYNNNHNIYVDDVDTYVAKLKEGIKMYDQAAHSGVNPWSEDFSDFDHVHRVEFQREYTADLQHCNLQNCGPQSVITAGCRGTSVE